MTTRTRPAPLAFAAPLMIAVLVIVGAYTLHAHWGAFLQWCLSLQIALHRYLVLYLLQLNNHQYTGGLWLLTGAFIYGVLHAIGPGHGKFIATTYLSTNRETLKATRLIPFFGSLMQGVSAILFVFILAVGFNLAAGDLSQSRWYVEKISAVLIGGFGLWLVLRAVKESLPALRPATRFTAFRPHQHDASCGCGHHGVGQAQAQAGDWKTRLGIILAIGARPCSGAIMILLFSNALGIVTWGIAAVMTMSLGTGLSIMGMSLAVRYARQAALRYADNRPPRQLQWLLLALRVAGGLALMLFALILFLTVIPVSANGDYIAAGC
jgi:ABC-type nickel/cobalt efflux system permease component RcnA